MLWKCSVQKDIHYARGLKLKLLWGPNEDLYSNPIQGPHYDADATMVPDLTRNSFYILFPAKGIMSYRQIILAVSTFV